MKKFELFMCSLGNGVTVCNKAVMENGDYKKIAHINNHGNIEYYVKSIYDIPGDVLLKIEHQSDVIFEKWYRWFLSMTQIQQYAFLLDNCTTTELLDIGNNKEMDLEEKIQRLKEAYLSRH